MYDDAIGQTRDHVKRLEKACPGRAIHGVLLTASGHEDGASIVAKRQEERRDVPMSHVSWHRIHEIITSLYLNDFAADTDVRSFVPQYLEVVERIIHPGERIVEKLLSMHAYTLERLSEANGETAIGQVDESRRETLSELVGAFRQRPAEQRSEIEEYLKGKGFTTTRTGRGSARWLTWEIKEGARALKSGWNWSIGFYLRGVTLTLQSPPLDQGDGQGECDSLHEGESHREVAAAGRGGQVSHGRTRTRNTVIAPHTGTISSTAGTSQPCRFGSRQGGSGRSWTSSSLRVPTTTG